MKTQFEGIIDAESSAKLLAMNVFVGQDYYSFSLPGDTGGKETRNNVQEI